MQAGSGGRLGGLWRALRLRLLAGRIAADLRRRPPQLLRDIGVEPHALEATALALAAQEVGRGRSAEIARAFAAPPFRLSFRKEKRKACLTATNER